MEFLRLLEVMRTPFLDTVMSAVTLLGEETLFMAIAMFVFWCVNKNRGYYLLTLGFVSALANQTLKLLFRIPRPWVHDESFTIVESAREGATGYSFPSGHTASASATLGGVARFTKKLWLRILCIVLIVAVSLSRLYLGVHTPLDVGVSLLISLVMVFALWPLFKRADKDPRILNAAAAGMVVLAAAGVLFVELFPFPADIDATNLASGVKSAYTMLGASAGVAAVMVIDAKFIRFETDAIWWAQIIKVVVGLGIAVGIRFALKALFVPIFGGHFAESAVRYFLMTLAAGAAWPACFRFFPKKRRES